MKQILLALFWSSIPLSLPALHAAQPAASAEIDAILEQEWKTRGVTPAPIASDEVFVRRIYLDIIGRIPTMAETEAFLQSPNPEKRGELIDQLLGSEGYVSHYFNYWADILRLQTQSRVPSYSGPSLALWLKDSLRTNKRYDDMVTELVTAKGGIWENRAVGFYLRDQGMPLDQLATTVQVFLGTSIVCAQCHDHPFDKWTQLDYYRMAAFTYGVDTNVRTLNLKSKPDKRLLTAMGGTADMSMSDSADAEDSDMMSPMTPRQKRQARKEAPAFSNQSYQYLRRAVGNATQGLRRSVVAYDNDYPKLPSDYQYDNAKPGQIIPAETIFGQKITANKGEPRPVTFAKWMTSPENPRFTTVIANRLWKKAFGRGVFEPVDEITDTTKPEMPALLTRLEKVMRDTDYNLKSYLRVVYNTRAYQRVASPAEDLPGAPPVFNGPQLRRMSAEQIWDSLVTLAVPDTEIDERDTRGEEAVARQEENMKKLNDQLSSFEPKQLATAAMKLMNEVTDLNVTAAEMREEIAALKEEGKDEEAAKLSREAGSLRREIERKVLAELAPDYDPAYRRTNKMQNPRLEESARAELAAKRRELVQALGPKSPELKKKLQVLRNKIQKTGEYLGDMTRASNLPSPAPAGHFLSRFGQADRDTVESSIQVATVPQALDLLNGPFFGVLNSSLSKFGSTRADADTRADRERVIFLSLLNRFPQPQDGILIDEIIRERGEKDAWDDLVYAILNSNQFLFIQ